jgi:hypothetical protein
MTTYDIEFALRSARYLRAHGLRLGEIESVLRAELDCPPRIAHGIAVAL